MFLGSYEPSFDVNSRRVALPKKLREHLATNDIILSLGFEKCIFGFDTKSWEEESKKQLTGSLEQKQARDLRRFFFSQASHIKLDGQGRFVIPSDLYQYARIKIPIIIGAGDHFEVWDKTYWQSHQNRLQGTIK